jgi:hypothetical protein
MNQQYYDPNQQHQYQQQQQQQQYYDQNQQQQQQDDPQHQQEQEQQPPAGPSAYEVRWSWNKFPTQKLDATRMVIPLGCMFSPFSGPAPEVQHAPLKCSVCAGMLNCFATVDYRSKTWQCPLCTNRNTFPPQYSSITQDNAPAELMPEYQTIEYILPSSTSNKEGSSSRTMQPVYVILVDACTSTKEELEALKEVLHLTVEKLPTTARVAFISMNSFQELPPLLPSLDLSFSEAALKSQPNLSKRCSRIPNMSSLLLVMLRWISQTRLTILLQISGLSQKDIVLSAALAPLFLPQLLSSILSLRNVVLAFLLF